MATKPQIVSCVIQEDSDSSFVSTTDYADRLKSLECIHNTISRKELTDQMSMIGYLKFMEQEYNLPNQKRLVRKKSSSWLKNAVWIEALSTSIIALLFLVVSLNFGVSIWFAITFLIISWIDTAFDYKTLRIPSNWFSELDVITLRKRLLHQKTLRKKQYLVSLPLAVIWGVWFGYEMLIKGIGKDITLDFTSYAVFFVVIGIAVASGVGASLVIYRKAQRTNDELVNQLNEFQTEE